MVRENAGLVGALVSRTLRLFPRLPTGYDRDDVQSLGYLGLLRAAQTGEVGVREQAMRAIAMIQPPEILQAFAFEGRADEAYRPLLIAASAEPGFLGHTLTEVHTARLASRFLTPSENAWLSWKLYRTLTTRFGYPEFLRLGKPENQDRPSMLAAVESSLRYKSPPAEETVRHALEADVPLEDILAAVVDFYGQWTVGEKEHTISYLNAVLQTAKFLGKAEALLPLAIGLSKLPF